MTLSAESSRRDRARIETFLQTSARYLGLTGPCDRNRDYSTPGQAAPRLPHVHTCARAVNADHASPLAR